jgi:hypothetical protein
LAGGIEEEGGSVSAFVGSSQKLASLLNQRPVFTAIVVTRFVNQFERRSTGGSNSTGKVIMQTKFFQNIR